VDFGFTGTIYPINPQAQKILGLTAYARLADVPGPVEYAIVSVPPGLVPQAIEDCATIGVKAVHIYTSGFCESEEPEGDSPAARGSAHRQTWRCARHRP
jgi:acetate---CoA ligase (ADP-forming)